MFQGYVRVVLDIRIPIKHCFFYYSPENLKTNMEPENHPFGREHALPNLHFGVPCPFFGSVHNVNIAQDGQMRNLIEVSEPV